LDTPELNPHARNLIQQIQTGNQRVADIVAGNVEIASQDIRNAVRFCHTCLNDTHDVERVIRFLNSRDSSLDRFQRHSRRQGMEIIISAIILKGASQRPFGELEQCGPSGYRGSAGVSSIHEYGGGANLEDSRRHGDARLQPPGRQTMQRREEPRRSSEGELRETLKCCWECCCVRTGGNRSYGRRGNETGQNRNYVSGHDGPLRDIVQIELFEDAARAQEQAQADGTGINCCDGCCNIDDKCIGDILLALSL
jgi:hypothetical protein